MAERLTAREKLADLMVAGAAQSSEGIEIIRESLMRTALRPEEREAEEEGAAEASWAEIRGYWRSARNGV